MPTLELFWSVFILMWFYSVITTARVIFDRDSRTSRGFGFVTVDSAEDLRSACEDLNDTVSDVHMYYVC